jgi:NADH-quinone oxidoreductase subunit L
MLHVIWHIVTGFVVGLLARALLPGGDQMGLIATTVLGVVGSVVGGFIAVPHFLEPQLALPAVHESLHAAETPLLVVSVVLAFAGLAAAAFLFGGPPERAERLRARFAGIHRVLSGKYFIDELYERVIGRPLVWISDRIFLRLGDRALLDGTLNGMAAIGRGTGRVLARIQTGSLHFYAWLVLVGIAGALIWSWRHV